MTLTGSFVSKISEFFSFAVSSRACDVSLFSYLVSLFFVSSANKLICELAGL